MKQLVMEEEEELLTEVLTVWFVLLLKLDEVVLFISFVLPGELAELAPFVFWLAPFAF